MPDSFHDPKGKVTVETAYYADNSLVAVPDHACVFLFQLGRELAKFFLEHDFGYRLGNFSGYVLFNWFNNPERRLVNFRIKLIERGGVTISYSGNWSFAEKTLSAIAAKEGGTVKEKLATKDDDPKIIAPRLAAVLLKALRGLREYQKNSLQSGLDELQAKIEEIK
jgi:hypothetical protein